ncbi:diphthamide biosynthesis protein 2 [Onchocerca flexuosa]|uniref:2-(3-amino-3-carboxypropyl)histidine synthase subunit 2 n=1 Tax=Onchocerca flexuosa TaxID=387005 RepID=A0A238BX19_9BILA|nr:diphthamide biosynthesis protein 2 [Onchocerca flexuosa]
MGSLSAEEHILKQLTKDMDSIKLKRFFNIDSTVSWINNNDYRKVALQFPDYLLSLSAGIATLLEKECDENVKTYILADTTYRSCCVDFVAAEQCGADCIVHYGDSCMSETMNRLPTWFVFGDVNIELERLKEAVHEYKDKFERNCCLLFDAVYANSSGMSCCLGRISPKRKQNMTLLFIGEINSPLLPLWLMTNLNCTSVFTFSPITLKYSFERTPATRLLKKRLFLIEKLRDAQTVGIVVNTLDLVGYREALERTRKLCKVAGKKSYTLAVGKINVPKLSNFANDIEAFIVLSCPYGIILDVSDFYRPVLSVFEAEAALNPQCRWLAGDGWTAEFKDFLHISFLNSLHTKFDEDCACNIIVISHFIIFLDEIGSEADVESDLSLVTGKMRFMGVKDNVNCDITSFNAENSCNTLSTYTAGDYFSQRTWKGLDDNYAGESVAMQEGRSGIASKYSSEQSV